MTDAERAVNELIDFLNAQIDYDHRIATCALADGETWEFSDSQIMGDGVSLAVGAYGCGIADGTGRHMAHFDPRHALREIEAKCRIMARHSRFPWADEGSPHTRTMCAGCGYGDGVHADDPVTAHIDDCPELRDLASVYEDRPGWKERWRV